MKSRLTRQAQGKTAALDPRGLPWYRRMWVGIEVGPNASNDQDRVFYSRASGKEFLGNLVKANVEYAVIFLKDQDFAYYNSKVARKCPNIGERDLLRECLDEAKKYAIPIIAYCQVQYDTSSWRAHPEWRMKDPSGQEIPVRLCFNSGYVEFIKQILGEMMEYEIAGFHVDMLDFGFEQPCGCWCDYCQRAFQKEYGIPMPSGVTWDEAWEKMLEFRTNSNTRFCQNVQAFIRAKRPDISVDFNYHGYPPFAWLPGQLPVKHAVNGDFVTAEGLPAIFGHNNVSLLAQFLAGARLGGPTQVATNRGVAEYHDPTVRPVEDLKWEVLTYLSHGTQCTIVDKVNYDGTGDPVAYERIGEVFAEARRKGEYWGHKPVQEVGVYYSSRSRDWYAREDSPKYMAAFRGAHWALMRSQIPLGIIMDENVSPERLKQFPIVYLAGTAILSEREVALFEEYVAEGGKLLATGVTGLYDKYGNLEDHCSLSKLLGVRLVRSLVERSDNYFRLPKGVGEGEGKFLSQDIPPNWPVLTWGPMAVYEPTTAQAYGELMVGFPPGSKEWGPPMSAEKPVGPAVFANRHGKGLAVLVACAVDLAYTTKYRAPEHRLLIRNLIRYLNPRPVVIVKAQQNVEAVVTRDEDRKRILVHLIAFSGPATASAAQFGKGALVLPPLMEEPMHYEAQIKINRPFSKAALGDAGGHIKRKGNSLTVTSSHVHEVVIVSV